jgi:N-glycosylase/DNA lyase
MAWAVCADLLSDAVVLTPQPDVKRFQDELVFCLLGGYGVTFELAVSAASIVLQLDPFGAGWSSTTLRERLIHELERPQFEPRRTDGQLRRYRFPTRKAELLVQARGWLLNQNGLLETLASVEGERDRRQLLCQCPGIGLKTASWLLRNLGLASRLAIVDVHLMRALEEAGRIRGARLPRDYEIVEEAFLGWCRELEAPPSAFDLFLWQWQRGSLVRPH